MAWIVYSILMFTFSNTLYLLIRKAQKDGMKTSIYSISMFLVPALIYFGFLIFSETAIIPPFKPLVLVIISAFLWSYLGNFFSQKGILYAPNPGYSLILQKSYVIVTTIFAYFLFGAELSLPKVLGILVILAFAALISISKEKKESQSKWVWFSLGAHLCFAYGSLISKQFLNLGLEAYQYLFYIFMIVSGLNFLESQKKNVDVFSAEKDWLLLLGIGVSSALFNLFMQLGYKTASNPGYVAAINTSSIMSVSLFSTWLFDDKLSMRKMVGIVGVSVGLLLMIFS